MKQHTGGGSPVYTLYLNLEESAVNADGDIIDGTRVYDPHYRDLARPHTNGSAQWLEYMTKYNEANQIRRGHKLGYTGTVDSFRGVNIGMVADTNEEVNPNFLHSWHVNPFKYMNRHGGVCRPTCPEMERLRPTPPPASGDLMWAIEGDPTRMASVYNQTNGSNITNRRLNVFCMADVIVGRNVLAAADGIVIDPLDESKINWASTQQREAFGNLVILRHIYITMEHPNRGTRDELYTFYGGLEIASGLSPGTMVRKGEPIGKVVANQAGNGTVALSAGVVGGSDGRLDISTDFIDVFGELWRRLLAN
jgi:hypothetical protein